MNSNTGNNTNHHSIYSSANHNSSESLGRPPATAPVGSMSTAAAAAASSIMQRGNQYPSTGEQMDMQVLYELIGNLAEVQSSIREQTAGVLQRVQMIQQRDLNGAEEATANGATHADDHPTNAVRTQAYLDEIGSLRSRLSGTTSTLNTLATHQNSLQALLAQHESALSTLLTKLRPYATHHTQALESQKVHYLALLEAERIQNQDLRLTISRQQDGLGRVLNWIREEENAERGRDHKWRGLLAGLRAENRVLRSICGFPIDRHLNGDSGESSEDESLGMGTGPAAVVSSHFPGRDKAT